jgi:endonuclease YncB( thermonuclease family)
VRSKSLLAAIVMVCLPSPITVAPSLAQELVTVVKVYDGDTVTLSDGTRVRLIQIDAPEVSEGECFAVESRRALSTLIRRQIVTFEPDPILDQVDRFGRRLGYLFIRGTNVNLRMIELGAAAPYFYQGRRGTYSDKMQAAANDAVEMNRGLWKKCPGTKLRPYSALETVTFARAKPSAHCDPNYAGCVPSFPPDLDCSDLRKLGLSPVRVTGRDVHRLDQDGDGLGCT